MKSSESGSSIRCACTSLGGSRAQRSRTSEAVRGISRGNVQRVVVGVNVAPFSVMVAVAEVAAQDGSGLAAQPPPQEVALAREPTAPLCRHWARRGACLYGDACKFRHDSCAPSGVGRCQLDSCLKAPSFKSSQPFN